MIHSIQAQAAKTPRMHEIDAKTWISDEYITDPPRIPIINPESFLIFNAQDSDGATSCVYAHRQIKLLGQRKLGIKPRVAGNHSGVLSGYFSKDAN